MAHLRNVDALCVPAVLAETARSAAVGHESTRLQAEEFVSKAVAGARQRLADVGAGSSNRWSTSVAARAEPGAVAVDGGGLEAAEARCARLSAKTPFPSQARAAREFVMDSSILRQLDGLCAAILGGDYRLERDVMAQPGRSICRFVGREPWEALSSFTGLYMGELESMGAWVALASAHHACGVFVAPRRTNCGPWIAVKGKKRPLGGRFPATQRGWFDHLMLHARMEFEVPYSAFVPLPKERLVVVLANFSYVGKFRSKQRKERRLVVPVVPALRVGLG